MLQTRLAAAKTSDSDICCHILLKTSGNTKITSGHSDLFWCQSQTFKNPGEWNIFKLTERTCLLFITLMIKKWLLVKIHKLPIRRVGFWGFNSSSFLQEAGWVIDVYQDVNVQSSFRALVTNTQITTVVCHNVVGTHTHTHPKAATYRQVAIWLLNQSMLILEHECESWKVMTPLRHPLV